MEWRAVEFIDLNLADFCSQFAGPYFAGTKKDQHRRLSLSLHFPPVEVIAITKAKFSFIAPAILSPVHRQSQPFYDLRLRR